MVNAVGNVVDRNNGELVPTPVAAPPPAEASASSGGSSGVLSPNAFVQGAKDRVKQKFWAGLEELPGAVGTVFAAVHLYVKPEEKAAELSRPAEAPALDPFSQVIGAVKSAVNFFNADKEARSRAAGALTVDLLQQLAGALILGAAAKGTGGASTPEPTMRVNVVEPRLRGTAPRGPTERYNRAKHYGRTPTASDRRALGAGPDEVVDHQPELVKRYYEGDPTTGEKPGYTMTPEERAASGNDRSRMRLQPSTESTAQGGEARSYSWWQWFLRGPRNK